MSNVRGKQHTLESLRDRLKQQPYYAGVEEEVEALDYAIGRCKGTADFEESPKTGEGSCEGRVGNALPDDHPVQKAARRGFEGGEP